MRVARDVIAGWDDPDLPDIRIVYDSVVAGDPADVEIERAQRLVSIPGLVGVVGHGGSRGSLAAAPVYNEAGVPQIVPMGTSQLLRTAGPWTFTLAPDDSVEGAFIGSFIAKRSSVDAASIFYVNDEYGTGLRQGVLAEFRRHGIDVLDQVPVDPTSDFAPLVEASLRNGRPGAVVLATRHVAAGRMARLFLERVPGVRLVAGDGALNPNLPREAGPAADSIHVVAFWTADSPAPISRAFVERFRRLIGREPLSFDAMTHDALMLLATAVREAGPDREAIRQYLLDLGRARPAYRGVTGPITFQDDRPTRLVMVRLRKGEVVPVTEPSATDS